MSVAFVGQKDEGIEWRDLTQHVAIYEILSKKNEPFWIVSD